MILQVLYVLGYASDGENLMQGASNSLLTKIKEKVPDVFVLKCFCHSFHLVACYACKKLSRSAEQLVHDIYNYFKNSFIHSFFLFLVGQCKVTLKIMYRKRKQRQNDYVITCLNVQKIAHCF